MKTILKPIIGASLLLAISAQPALAAKKEAAPATGGPVVAGLGVANIEAIKVNSNANKVAQQQRPTTYKPQIDQANARAMAIQAQIKPLVDKFDRDRAAAAPNATLLQQQYAQIQQLQQSGQQEINRILQPVAYSEAYVEEQINEQLEKAISQAAAKKRVGLIITPESVIYADAAYNMNQAVLEELNTLIPSAQLVPPAGWEPRQVREQRAQQQGAAAAAPRSAAPAAPRPATPAAPRPSGPQPDGR